MLVITGGGGFIGSVLAAALNAAGRSDLVIVDRFGTGDKWRNIAKRNFSDILPVEGLPAWLDRYGTEVEAVFHLGANSSTFASSGAWYALQITSATSSGLFIRERSRFPGTPWSIAVSVGPG